MYGRPRRGLEPRSALNHQATSKGRPSFPAKALEELRVQEGYAELPTASPLGSFDPELASLPAGDKMPEDFVRAQTLRAAEAREKLEASGVAKRYEDPRLRDPTKYKIICTNPEPGLLSAGGPS